MKKPVHSMQVVAQVRGRGAGGGGGGGKGGGRGGGEGGGRGTTEGGEAWTGGAKYGDKGVEHAQQQGRGGRGGQTGADPRRGVCNLGACQMADHDRLDTIWGLR